MADHIDEVGEREYDLVLFGSTGFTGSRAARRIARSAPTGLRWAVAGRREGAVRALAEELGAGAIVADVHDTATVRAMASATRVLLNTAGPFSKYGDPVVDACVEACTHYADLTGEVPWMRRVAERHHPEARARGVRILPASGFDSAPADLAVLLALEEAARRCRRLESARTVYRLRGGLNGGTLASALQIFEEADPRLLADPFALAPGHHAPPGRRRALADPRRPAFDPTDGRWVAPFFMGPINRRVVRRSVVLRAGGPLGDATADGFRYDEFQSVSRGRGWVASRVATLALGAMEATLRTRAGRALARRLGPAPGEGPDEATLAAGLTRAATTCTLEGGERFIVRQEIAGDPGNAATVRILVESGLALVEGGADLELRPGTGGVLTPSTGLGATLVRRLRATGEHDFALEGAPRP